MAYQRANSLPSSGPSTQVTYNVASRMITSTSIGNGWVRDASLDTTGNNLYFVTAVVSTTGATDTILTTDWSSPTLLAPKGDTGDTGEAGSAGAAFIRISRSGNAPSTAVSPTNTEVMTSVGRTPVTGDCSSCYLCQHICWIHLQWIYMG